ncbi:threonine--tRNA ligase [Rubinisphaera brasiliensis]|uniref:Threonine--tRNA ligase n=1 Tax=Rubinisphaera brasiliensis (strain ATCC 49424 / DSM 5305 / JCM 21570 / IAM 15109 / NBRC 103401 / IFAM 1448) TaxID=756272 RepID=F0SQF6_RUBBR|nr:threonine--tRNA ligase [Rubinisphaera brasiliensis]ADY57931.1 Ser-tRNA(Thr) hydrolase; threonyl-tRNA synthetase [Rubinisphaera brasiliensis DSM 5305]
MINVTLPDGSVREYADDTTALDIARGISERLANDVIAADVNGQIADVARPLQELVDDPTSISLKLLTVKDQASLGVMRHSCAHIMARAVMRLFPGTGLAFGPTTGHGFYYDFDLDERISEEDFPRIEQEMANIISEGEPFERFALSRDEAVELCEGMNQELKVEHIRTGLSDHGNLSFYRQGEFVDLCRGPHIPRAGKIKAFKLLSVAGAHWKGDQSGKSLQRLYGTAWFDKKDLKNYLEQIEEAKRRDHRVLGKRLHLFQIDPHVGQGLCLWLPKGATIRALLEDFIKKELLERQYEPVYSPHIGRVELYETSGHFPYYRDSQFAPIFGHDAGRIIDYCIRKLQDGELSGESEQTLLQAAEIMGYQADDYQKANSNEEKIAALRKWEKQQERYLLKPMNCPHHAQIYKSQPRSYRDLPVRLAEFGTVYRHEQTGELNGMLRVRGLTQDDAHLFCMPEQVEEEFRQTLELVQFVLKSVGLNDYRVQLSLRDPGSDKYVGSEENWQQAEASLRKVLNESGLSFTACEGEAAFYGPKADFMVRDAIGREWQLGTVQLDYNLPERFELEYVGADNKMHRPVMIHRAPFGSMERFVGMLIEHFAGAFPLWLAPEQIRVLPVTDKVADYAQDVVKRLKKEGFRTSADMRSCKVNAKIRDAQLELIPYMLVVGPKEAEQNAVSVRDRIESADIGMMPLDDAIAKFRDEVTNKEIRQSMKSSFTGLEESETADNEY